MTGALQPSGPPPARRHRRRWFLAGWTVFATAVVLLLWFSSAGGWRERVMVLRDGASSREAVWVAARGNLLLAHLGLSRGYPWVLLAPYVIWAAFRFSLDREHFRRHLLIQGLLAAGFVAGSQTLNHRVTAGQPARVIIAITESTTREDTPGGAPAEPEIRTRREIRYSKPGIQADEIEESREALPLESEREGDNAFIRRTWWEGPPSWPSNAFKLPGPALPFALIWRGKVASMALDLFVFVSLCGLGHAAHFRRRFQEREQRATMLESSLARARLHTLQARLQPHFLFNTLNSIAALTRQNPDAAEDMLTSLSDLLRLALSRTGEPWSRLGQELHFVRLYLDIQRMRFGDRLRYVEEVEAEALEAPVPSLLLQPLVENAIRHGIEPAQRPGAVRLRARIDGTYLEVSVKDDGLGCPGLARGTVRLGVGLSNVREQLQTTCGTGAGMQFFSKPSEGLEVCLRLPIPDFHRPGTP